MSDRQDLLDATDASKLHAEINQLRNQEFLITSFALAFFAGSISEIAQEPGLSIALLVVLAALFLWYYALCALRTRISVYLEVTNLSKWEGDYRTFADIVTFPSQRTVSTIFFGVLGLLGTAIPSVRFLGVASADFPMGLLVAIVASLLAYLVFVSVLGLRSYAAHRDYFKSQWEKALARSVSGAP